MKNLGENCKKCLCATCEYLPYCRIMFDNTEDFCEIDCLGKGSCTTGCSEYE